MRIAFILILLAGAIFYSYIAFSDLSFMTRTGRLGPGFFPRIIGVAAIVVIFWTLIDLLRSQKVSTSKEHYWLDVVVLIALAIGYAVLLRLFGGFIATIIFLLVTLFYFNPGQSLKNLIVSVLVPSGVYLLFDQLLNANMPPALFALPL